MEGGAAEKGVELSSSVCATRWSPLRTLMEHASGCPHDFPRALRRCIVLTAHVTASSPGPNGQLSSGREMWSLRSQLHQAMMLNQALQHQLMHANAALQRMQATAPPVWMGPPHLGCAPPAGMILPPPAAHPRVAPDPSVSFEGTPAPQVVRTVDGHTAEEGLPEDPSTCLALVPSPGSRAHKA